MKKILMSGFALAAMVAVSSAAWADILVGVAGPLTGPNAAFGAQLQKGAQAAAEAINAAGGIAGRKIELVIEEETNPKDTIERFRRLMDAADPGWDLAAILSKINLFYFTGTMQDGMLLVPRDGEPCLWVRRSYERAVDESLFSRIRSMRSYRDASAELASSPTTVHLETEQVPIATGDRLRKHIGFREVRPLDRVVRRPVRPGRARTGS